MELFEAIREEIHDAQVEALNAGLEAAEKAALAALEDAPPSEPEPS